MDLSAGLPRSGNRNKRVENLTLCLQRTAVLQSATRKGPVEWTIAPGATKGVVVGGVVEQVP